MNFRLGDNKKISHSNDRLQKSNSQMIRSRSYNGRTRCWNYTECYTCHVSHRSLASCFAWAVWHLQSTQRFS